MEFQIRLLGRTCTATDKPLAPGDLVHSVLVEQDGEQRRLDFSDEGWTGPPEGTIGHWICIVPAPQTVKTRPLDADSLLESFERMIEDANPAQEQFCYVLSLLLLQKRRLRLDGSRRDGDVEYLQFVGSHGEGPYEVRDQQLSAEEIVMLQSALNEQLSSQESSVES